MKKADKVKEKKLQQQQAFRVLAQGFSFA